MERHPVDGWDLTKVLKSGGSIHGKDLAPGPGDIIESQMDPAPAVIDEGYPNYVDEEEERRLMKGEEEGVRLKEELWDKLRFLRFPNLTMGLLGLKLHLLV
ncbi:hypothetical protein IFM89_015267 [Coptis chinensis]|uniref:Uncharacterized protein n=1 Tax=Coptis chinensis TaxID=261450 RepID=A0A835HBY2_9MAGN|nr:hypothetical protein IFM89_015267 [Coptis chinensis]